MSSLNTLIRGGGVWAGTLNDTVQLTASAAGANQGTATAITKDITAFTTVAASTGAILPKATVPGESYLVANLGANALALYPPVGHSINSGAANASVSVAAAKAARAVYCGSSKWLVIVGA